MKVWVHINGTQEGPFELEQLPLDRMDANTPVWYNGLNDWVPACQAPEVARFIETASAQPQTAQPADEPRQPLSEQPADDPRQPLSEQHRHQAEQPYQQPQPRCEQPNQPRFPQPGYPQPQPWGYQQPAYRQPYQQPASAPWQVPVGPDGKPLPCPPNYLVWSILLTVLCCNPIGIVAIVYGSGVKSKFYSGNVEGARRASQTTEWWLAISIVTGLIMSCCMGFII